MSTILFAWELGGGLGHCVKLAPIAAGLIASGHTVYFAARDIVTARQVGRDLPIIYLPAPHLAGRSASPARETFSFAHILHNAGFGDDEQLGALVDNWRNLITLVNPAAILCEHAPTALLASRLENLPRFVMGTGFSLPPHITPLPDLRPKSTVTSGSLTAHETQLVDRVNRLFGSDSGQTLGRLAQLYQDVDDRFLMTFAELDHHGRRDRETYRGTWTPTGGTLPQWPSGAGPKVFAYLKTGTNPWRIDKALAALRDLKMRTIAYVPGATPSLSSLQGPSLTLCERPLDMSVLKSECDLAVLHGTAGATTQFLLAGVPVLLAPLYFEQAVLSMRVADLGGGLVLNPRRVEHLKEPVERLIQDKKYRCAAEAFAKRYAHFDADAAQSDVVSLIDIALNR